MANGVYAAVSGVNANSAFGDYSTVSGGANRYTYSANNWAAGPNNAPN